MNSLEQEVPVSLTPQEWREVLESLRVNQESLESKSLAISGLYQDILGWESSKLLHIIDSIELELSQSFAEK